MKEVAAPGHSEPRTVRAPRGAERACRGWSQEAALRMLMNSVDEEIAERPRDLVIFGDSARAARDWPSFDSIAGSLRELESDETLLVQSGKPVAIFPTRERVPRVLIAGDNASGHANGPLTVSARMAAGNWTYVGAQEILQNTYETFAAAARKHFGGDLAGKLIVTGGMGRTGGTQPLAATMNGAAILCVEIDPERIKQWMKRGYCEVMVNSLDEALRILKNAVRKREAASVGLCGNSAGVMPELAERGVVPDLLTDQTGARDPLTGYVPSGLTMDKAADLRSRDPEEYRKRARESIARHAEAMLALEKLGSKVFDFGNGIGQAARDAGVKNASDFPDFVSEYLRPLLCEGRGQIRCVALSGEPRDIRRIDQMTLELFGEDESRARWIRLAQKQVRFQGLPARFCSLGYGERERFGAAINDLVARGELQAPVLIACSDFDAASAPVDGQKETTREQSDLVPDGPLLNALVDAASRASWISIQRVGTANGGWQQAALAVVADGEGQTGACIGRLLTNDSAMGIARLADAGYPAAVEFARRHGILTHEQA